MLAMAAPIVSMEWSALERGLLHAIFTRLPSDVDALHFRHVCHRWRAAAGAGAPVSRPWFVLLPSDGSPGPHRHAYLRLAGCRRRRRRTRARPVRMMDATVKGSAPDACATSASRGWLAVNAGGRLLLRDPVSRVDVPLPAFDPAYRLLDVFLSDDPLHAPGRWTVFATFTRKDYHYAGHALAFHRAGDAEWVRLDQAQETSHGRQYLGLEFFRGRVYALLGCGRVAVCDLDARRLVVSSVAFVPPSWGHVQACIMDCGGNLMFVQVARRFVVTRSRCFGRRYHPRYAAKVFKIEIAADGTPVALLDVQGIGDYAMFVAPRGHAFALPASGFPSVKGGCVYHFATKWDTGIVSEMVITDLHGACRSKLVRKLPLAGQWAPLSWLCPRRPLLGNTPARR
ncbi:hypothetical protein ACP70R_020998 [Stipagrostis hirtigluma subsp. patula]